jgi:parallel beta-helix repeat protein
MVRAGVVGVVGLLFGAVMGCVPDEEPPPDSQLIGCESADERIEITGNSHLDPSCIYSKGFDIHTSKVTLDCRGARVRQGPGAGSRGINIQARAASELENVTVRNCRVEGFLNSVRIWREDFRSLARGEEFLHPTRRIVLEQNQFRDSHGVGVFVDGYVEDVIIRDNLVTGAGSSGIYLETGSRRNVVRRNLIVDNGYRENGPGGQHFRIAGLDLWFWGVGREGISVDGSFENVIRENYFEGNSAGGIFLYKNCGEYPDSPRYFERRTPAAGNLIQENVFRGGINGVWVGSRMAENTLPMDCTDPAYVDTAIRRVVRDYAPDNTILKNAFYDVTYGIRVEDDGTAVVANTFEASSPDHHAVIVGTPDRTELLGEPVRGTFLKGNRSSIEGNDFPYRWIHGHAETEAWWNVASGREVPLCEGEPLPRADFIFVIAVVLAGPGGTPPAVTPDLTVPTLGAIAPCTAR